MDIDDTDAPRDPLQHVLTLISTALGLVLIGFGIWALAGAIYVTWGLFKDPDSISYFAKYFLETAKVTDQLSNSGEGLAHLLSWFSVVLLLLVLGKLGDWCITSGTQLLTLVKKPVALAESNGQVRSHIRKSACSKDDPTRSC